MADDRCERCGCPLTDCAGESWAYCPACGWSPDDDPEEP
jgi:uncharacterized Zn finger protein (UPF0148 family)